MPKFNEKMLEDYVIQKLQGKGWEFVKADDLEREGYDEPLLIKNLIRKIKEVNKEIELSDEDIKNVLNELKLKGTGSEGNKKVLRYIKFGVPVKLKKERTVKYIQLFNYSDIEKNEFIVTRQAVYYGHGRDEIRTDIVLYVNGIPLVNIELKNPASFAESWYDAYRQIKDYEKTVPELYKYVQVGIAAEQTAKYFPIVQWQDEARISEWKEKGIKDPVDANLEILSRKTLLDIIQNYIFHRIEMGEETKVITRHMQYRASEKIVQRVIENLAGKEDKNRGLIWHWQGSGKTLTMIFAANKLHHKKELENPSIFFIVDRIDLEDQLYREFNALDIVGPEIIGSIDELKSVLKHDEGRGKRGLMITLIHKFRVEELNKLQKELEEYSKDSETILNRKNVIAFLDEGHRTQYGIMAGQMKSMLKEAFFFAFTGTPISKKGKDTYKEFSYPPEEKYMDKYFVTDSLEDGFTVKIVYQPRLENYEGIHLKKEMLEIFLKVELDEIPEEARTKVEEKVKKRLNSINVFLENPKRINIIAEDIKEHFEEKIKGRYKAMVVATSRKACVHYKRALDKILPDVYSEVVMTYNRDDNKLIRDYCSELVERYKGRDPNDIKKDIVDNFNEEENPKILIVTDMLLTGFDAPILQTMYLDKPLKEHRLLQAIARTNRPYKDLKEAGLILDYIGILNEVAKAFEKYSEDDWKDTIYDMKYLRDEFNNLIDEILEILKSVPKDSADRKTLLKAVEVLTGDEEKGKKFLKKYKTLRKVFELLGADEEKLIRFEDYKWISGIYTYYMRTVLRSEPSYEKYAQQYFNKTLRFVRETTEAYGLEEGLPEISFDENYLRRMEEKVKNKEEKAANYVFTLNRYVLVERHKNPISETLAERVENILKLWREKTKDFEKIYKECVSVLTEREKLLERKNTLGFTDLEYSTLLILEKISGKDEDITSEVKELYDVLKKEKYMFDGWLNQPTATKKIEKEIRRFLRKYVKKHNLSLDKIDEIYPDLIENLKKYGMAN